MIKNSIVLIILFSIPLFSTDYTPAEHFVNECAAEFQHNNNIKLHVDTLIQIYAKAQYMIECSDEGAPQDVNKMYIKLRTLCPVSAKHYLIFITHKKNEHILPFTRLF